MQPADPSDDRPRTLVSFRVFSPGLDPNQVTELLQLIPDHAHFQGDHPRNNPKYAAYKHGMWSLHSKLDDEESFQAHLEHLLSILEPKKAEILKLSENSRVDFYCSLFDQFGFQLPPQILSRIADLGATFGAVLYLPDEPAYTPVEGE